ncbi:AAA family ATPase [Permianibacter sp. IMCC34836]|uniref:P-loop NTPase fold protein n=1 Tax=Permianibacter fluminis TaxID=2738515 RepID=UPI0015543809|nr:P-loop NTPase fold protein [Permianibacter fluminis]NQD36741.1 AAA family ATPase [Permianibacter fluminis]
MTRTAPTLDVNFLNDAPADDDYFSKYGGLGPHSRTADAIANLIIASNSGKSIGLEGEWGAGKSTIVNMVSRRLSRDLSEDVQVIVYDAWAHAGDPLRRSFLETIVAKLTEAGWLNREAWGNTLQEIRSRKERTTSKPKTEPTGIGYFFAFLLLMLPVTTTLLEGGLGKLAAFNLSYPVNWSFILGLFSFSPVAFIFIWSFYLRFVKNKKVFKLDNWEFITFAPNQHVESETTSTGEPTSIEFEKHFFDAMSDALGKHGNRKIVLVVDNLDRVDAQAAQLIWATLQVFLSHKERVNWKSQIWTIVPYAKSQLTKIWGAEEDDKFAIAESFLQKSLSIRFYAAPPILIGWKDYLTSLLYDAIPHNRHNEFHDIFIAYDFFGKKSYAFPTPRELKFFVNQICTIYIQWGGKFPLSHIAYFVIESMQRESISERMMNLVIPSDSATRLFGSELKRNMAAMLFNVDPDSGIEILLREPVQVSLFAEEGKGLEEILNAHGESFWLVLGRRISQSHGSSRELCLIASSLGSSGILSQDNEFVRRIHQQLKEGFGSITEWPDVDGYTAKALEMFFTISGEGFIVERTLKAIQRSLKSKSATYGESLAVAKEIIFAIVKIFSIQEVRGASVKDVGRFSIAGASPENWAQCCEYMHELLLGERDSIGWKIFEVGFSGKDYVSNVGESAVNSGKFSAEHLVSIDITGAILSDIPWGMFIGTIVSRLKSAQKLPADEVRNLLLGICKAERFLGSGQSAEFSAFCAGGNLYSLIEHAISRSEVTSLAAAVYVALVYSSTANTTRAVPHRNWKGEKDVLLAAMEFESTKLGGLVADVAIQMGGIPKLLNAVATSVSLNHLFLSGAVSTLTGYEGFASEVKLEDLSDNWFLLSRRLGRSLEVFIRAADIPNKICSEAFSSKYCGIYVSVININSLRTDRLVGFILDGISGITEGQWRSDLFGEGVCAELLVRLRELDVIQSIGGSFAVPYLEHVEFALSTPFQYSEETHRNWSILSTLLNEPEKNNLRALIKEATSAPGFTRYESLHKVYGRLINGG